MRRLMLALMLLAAVTGCGSKPAIVRPSTGCDGPGGSCVRYVQARDGDGAPLPRGTLYVPFTAALTIGERPEGLQAATARHNFDSRQTELALAPVTAFTIDPRTPTVLLIEIDGLLADGAAIDVPEDALKTTTGAGVPAARIEIATGLTPFAVALAGVLWEPTDPSLFQPEGLQPPRGAKAEAPVRQELEGRLRLRPEMTDEVVTAVLSKYDSAAAKKKIADHRIRAALLLLTGTSGEAAIDAILAETNRRKAPFEPLKVEPIRFQGAFAAVSYDSVMGKLYMIIDDELARDGLEMIATVLVHEAVHGGLSGGSATEETLAMASDTRVWQEFLLIDPSLAQTPTALTRSANRLTLALRNSGRFGYPHAGILPRPGVDDALRGVAREPVRSFKDMLFKPDYYGDSPKSGDASTELLEAYYKRIAGTTRDQGTLKFDSSTLKLFDQSMDHGFSDEQILAIHDALRLKPVPISR